LLLTVSITILGTSACKKETTQPANLNFTGTWYIDINDGSTFMRYSFKFNADSTAEYARGKASLTGTYLYDAFRKVGKYSYTSGQLKLYNLVSYINQGYTDAPDKNAYVQTGPQNLVIAPGSGLGVMLVPVIINSDNVSFTTNYPAECYTPTGDCFGIPKGVYKKL
jgi:hypothetical protein